MLIGQVTPNRKKNESSSFHHLVLDLLWQWASARYVFCSTSLHVGSWLYYRFQNQIFVYHLGYIITSPMQRHGFFYIHFARHGLLWRSQIKCFRQVTWNATRSPRMQVTAWETIDREQCLVFLLKQWVRPYEVWTVKWREKGSQSLGQNTSTFLPLCWITALRGFEERRTTVAD